MTQRGLITDIEQHGISAFTGYSFLYQDWSDGADVVDLLSHDPLKRVAQKWAPVFCEKDTLKQRDKAGRVNANERDML